MSHLKEKGNQIVLSNDFKIILEERDSHEITYRGSIDLPIHKWVRLTPSFSPHIVSRLIREFKCNDQSKILDPFMGIGTTILQCQFEGFDSIGIDINPFLHYVATMKTSLWQKDLVTLQNGVHDFLSKIAEERKKVKVPLSDFPRTIGVELPKLHNCSRWWKEEVLKDLLLCKYVLEGVFFEEDVKDFLKMGLISVLMDVANVTYEGVQFTFIDRSAENLDVFSSIRKRLDDMLKDVEYFQQNVNFKANISTILGDSTRISELLKSDYPTSVITSPPYPNRYSYVWNTRPYLYFFDFLSEPNEAAELDKRSIGGTWGKATSDLQKGKIDPIHSDVAEIVEETVQKIRSKNEMKNTNLMANYVMKYFNMLYQHMKSLTEVLAKNAKVAYVIGNSEIKGIEIPSDIWLGKIMEKSGFSVNRIVRVRRRHSGKRLYEAIVIGTY